ncbi:1,4-dihydroxy-2-naphthoate polyprenyltransferase, chloroplastic [Dorcoceras hygrometricum]|uniref:1,4-dihydroxy-2-naphthoate polyprenyltransferase, chloroplastic n=1 Tax=Dorcoceras hygrometricum TaxID=472368 RepID=A0A2Z7D8Y1_9LAMI|nr:1,4-dihydroxy-2-naphthoate polyprenyltransferase, chloroplastic [Dorcoceras hygrometricum]
MGSNPSTESNYKTAVTSKNKMQMLCMRPGTTTEGYNQGREPKNSMHSSTESAIDMCGHGECRTCGSYPLTPTRPQIPDASTAQPAVAQPMNCAINLLIHKLKIRTLILCNDYHNKGPEKSDRQPAEHSAQNINPTGRRHRNHGWELYTTTSYYSTILLNRKLITKLYANNSLREWYQSKEQLSRRAAPPVLLKAKAGNDGNCRRNATVNSVLGFEAKNNNREKISLNSIGYPCMSASGESSTTMHRLLHASGSHPIPTPYDPNVAAASCHISIAAVSQHNATPKMPTTDRLHQTLNDGVLILRYQLRSATRFLKKSHRSHQQFRFLTKSDFFPKTQKMLVFEDERVTPVYLISLLGSVSHYERSYHGFITGRGVDPAGSAPGGG